MNIRELTDFCGCRRKDILDKADLVVGCTLLNVLLNGSDHVPGVGNAKMETLEDDRVQLVIELDSKWQELLSKKDVKDLLVKSLSEKVW